MAETDGGGGILALGFRILCERVGRNEADEGSAMRLDGRPGTGRKIDLGERRGRKLAFDRLPVLADALQDAGCDHEDMLAHCRSGGPHVHGCWVVDRLLGRK